VKDRLFSGADVEEALAVAAASLGLPLSELRYVVLEAGGSGGRGLKPTPARIAVMLHEPRPNEPRPNEPRPNEPRPAARSAAEPQEAAPARAAQPSDVPSGIRALVGALAATGELALGCELEETEEALLVHLQGEGSAFFYGEDGKGEPLRALEHLLQRTYGEPLRPRVLRLRCAGFRERRDQALSEEARRLAAEVRADGQTRTLEPMNAYERRIVHLALQDASDVRTHSVGEGAQRRVQIEPAAAAEAGEPPRGGAGGSGGAEP
jgi:spoIIIJ-associated protein